MIVSKHSIVRLINTVTAAGIKLSISSKGVLQATGNSEVIKSFTPAIKAGKQDLIAFLKKSTDRRSINKTDKGVSFPSLAAITFFQKHKTQLHYQGWKPAELWRRNKSKGLCWSSIWDKPDLQVTIGKKIGSIRFTFRNAQGNAIHQTAMPDAVWKQKHEPSWWPLDDY